MTLLNIVEVICSNVLIQAVTRYPQPVVDAFLPYAFVIEPAVWRGGETVTVLVKLFHKHSFIPLRVLGDLSNKIMMFLTWDTGLWCCVAGWDRAASCSSSCPSLCSRPPVFSGPPPDGFCYRRSPQVCIWASHNLSGSWRGKVKVWGIWTICI